VLYLLLRRLLHLVVLLGRGDRVKELEIPGRPSTRADIREAVLGLARENPTWGYARISGELAGVGVRVPPSTVRDILKRAGLGSAPRRNGPTWAQFLKTQAEGIWACDLFHVDTVLFKRIYVLFSIEHATGVVHIAGATANPGRGVGRPAGPEPGHGPGRAGRTGAVPRPGP
jgi:hypothetical protein